MEDAVSGDTVAISAESVDNIFLMLQTLESLTERHPYQPFPTTNIAYDMRFKELAKDMHYCLEHSFLDRLLLRLLIHEVESSVQLVTYILVRKGLYVDQSTASLYEPFVEELVTRYGFLFNRLSEGERAAGKTPESLIGRLVVRLIQEKVKKCPCMPPLNLTYDPFEMVFNGQPVPENEPAYKRPRMNQSGKKNMRNSIQNFHTDRPLHVARSSHLLINELLLNQWDEPYQLLFETTLWGYFEDTRMKVSRILSNHPHFTGISLDETMAYFMEFVEHHRRNAKLGIMCTRTRIGNLDTSVFCSSKFETWLLNYPNKFPWRDSQHDVEALIPRLSAAIFNYVNLIRQQRGEDVKPPSLTFKWTPMPMEAFSPILDPSPDQLDDILSNFS